MENKRFFKRLKQFLKQNYHDAHSEAVKKGIYHARLKKQGEIFKSLQS